MRSTLALVLGASFVIAGLLGAGFLATQSLASAHEGEETNLHEQMHEMMDSMMGEGHSEAMHETMPNSEAMMEACAKAMDEHGMTGMGGMMDDMDGQGSMMRDGR